ncbi:hypothetical protein AX774_g3165 [Zancudomyces culisetae]|uniref:Uncharacterized protein n=1 Tax=Zancudomyces culisetae TaxID=1213189 RepID=A0A1R1PQW8_ZANCU|nr:hypothetical protein AX774_g3165 [Zancudomyces culisetae]|eukprot:OMH83331.1 hypothetical protein AX774_g3165 [Zancudomyces culisetae]
MWLVTKSTTLSTSASPSSALPYFRPQILVYFTLLFTFRFCLRRAVNALISKTCKKLGYISSPNLFFPPPTFSSKSHFARKEINKK